MMGARVKRLEDPRLLRGQASFVDDLRLPGVLHAAILRSSHAHARIRKIDLSAVRAASRNLQDCAARIISDVRSAPHREQSRDPRQRAWQTGQRHSCVNRRVVWEFNWAFLP